MNLDDIAKLLAKKNNQEHYIKHYLNNVFIKGFQKGAENSEKFAIGFANWCKQEYELEDTPFHNKWIDVNGRYVSTEELLEIYKKQQE